MHRALINHSERRLKKRNGLGEQEGRFVLKNICGYKYLDCGRGLSKLQWRGEVVTSRCDGSKMSG